ncbi:unnamed protein product, partial [Ascophyllum nodosum]
FLLQQNSSLVAHVSAAAVVAVPAIPFRSVLPPLLRPHTLVSRVAVAVVAVCSS